MSELPECASYTEAARCGRSSGCNLCCRPATGEWRAAFVDSSYDELHEADELDSTRTDRRPERRAAFGKVVDRRCYAGDIRRYVDQSRRRCRPRDDSAAPSTRHRSATERGDACRRPVRASSLRGGHGAASSSWAGPICDRRSQRADPAAGPSLAARGSRWVGLRPRSRHVGARAAGMCSCDRRPVSHRPVTCGFARLVSGLEP